MNTDRLLFEDEKGQRTNTTWDGAWPPPQKLYLVGEADASGRRVVHDPGARSDVLVIEGAKPYELRSASEMPEPARDDEYWFRGALYVAVGDSGD